MAMRKPIVASRSGAVPEIVEEQVSGLTFADGRPDELAAKVLYCLENPSEAARMAEAGFVRLTTSFGVAQNVEQTQRVYDDVLGTAAGAAARRRRSR
jgi:glycosyltransferase involved in cell wall biosynthesis